ncbi:hypothetical protein GOP47_0014372 [Adiantum capillus-veneris]|uniref:Secreted protein n=1 Tax=Adiantum capillus-veneris TaxID=13818 RepID=A0A9D4ZCE1_ADICA|nr:hypothetical protein GOP47_0014372 [Adiantum capillus-veneris]
MGARKSLKVIVFCVFQRSALAVFLRTAVDLVGLLDDIDISEAYTLLESVLEASWAVFSSCFEEESTCGCVSVPIQSWSLASLIRGVPCPLRRALIGVFKLFLTASPCSPRVPSWTVLTGPYGNKGAYYTYVQQSLGLARGCGTDGYASPSGGGLYYYTWNSRRVAKDRPQGVYFPFA